MALLLPATQRTGGGAEKRSHLAQREAETLTKVLLRGCIESLFDLAEEHIETSYVFDSNGPSGLATFFACNRHYFWGGIMASAKRHNASYAWQGGRFTR